jgi:ATP-binding cassette subfamily B protein
MSEVTLENRTKLLTGWRANLRFLQHYLRSQSRRVMGLAVLILLSIVLQLINPQVIRYFLDTAGSGGPRQALLWAAAAFITFALLRQGMDLATTFLNQLVSWSTTNQVRLELARHCLKLDLSFHKQHTPGELIERIDGDVSRLGNFFSQLSPRLLGNGLLILGILALLMREDGRVGAGMLLYTALTLVLLGLIQRPAATRWADERQASAEKFSFLEERISGAEDIRACGAEPYALNRLLLLLRSYLEKLRAAFVVSNLTQNLTNLVYVIGYAIGLALGVYLYTRGQATLGTAYLILSYVGMLAEPLQGIRAQIQDLQLASASLQRVRDLFAIHPQASVAQSKLPDQDGYPTHLPPGALPVDFEEVSFAYENQESDAQERRVLHEISFRLQPGKVLGILGRTGSGKSTLTRLLFRLYEPDQGIIRLGGVDIRTIALAELRQRVGMVTQEVQLFEASLRSNLSFFNPDISSEQIEAALKTLRLWEWAQALPQGLDTRLAAGQQGLSAGEAQLLAFARVFLKNPGLVILDEASSRLDPLTETLMEQAVDRLFAGRTGILIAHRLKTVQRADEILILENGRVVEAGARQALIADPNSRFSTLLQTGLEEVLV